jgi:hypothetical protein
MGAFLMKAFPTKNENLPNESQGMDLRDYFAAKAMPLITKTYTNCWISNKDFEGFSEMEMECIAEGSYDMADIMMKVRNDQKR